PLLVATGFRSGERTSDVEQRGADGFARPFPARCKSPSAFDRGPGSQADEAGRTWRRGREADDDRIEPAPGRLDCQELPPPGPPLSRPDSGGNAGTDARGRQVRLAPRLQVLD